MPEEIRMKCQCGATMQLVVQIPPLGGQPGLSAYECPTCRAVASYDEPPRRERLEPRR